MNHLVAVLMIAGSCAVSVPLTEQSDNLPEPFRGEGEMWQAADATDWEKQFAARREEERTRTLAAIEALEHPVLRAIARESLDFWDKLESEKREVDGQSEVALLNERSIRESVTFRKLVELKAAATFAEIGLLRGGALIGLIGMRELNPRESTPLAIRAALEDQGAVLYGDAPAVMATLGHRIGERALLDDLMRELGVWTSASRGSQAGQISLLLHRFKLEPHLDPWFHEADRPHLPITIEASILSQIWGERAKSSQEPSARMKEVLEECSLTPGAPRAVFATYGDLDRADMQAAVRETLQWEEPQSTVPLPSNIHVHVTMLLLRRSDWIRENVDLNALNVSPERKESIDILLRRKREDPLRRPPS